MKSAIAAAILMASLVLTCWYVSISQEKAIAPILEKVGSIETLNKSLSDEERKNALNTIKAAKEDFENRNFFVEIGVPQKEVGAIITFMEKAIIYLETKEDALFFTQVKELTQNLNSLKNYGKISLKNIT